MSDKSHTYKWELLLNQVWQGLNFLSKGAFLALLTPLMLHVWGSIGYGMFALASSLLVSLAILDCGIRSLTRLRLCEALRVGDEEEFSLAVVEGTSAFALMALLAFLLAVTVAHEGGWSRSLNLPPEGDFLIGMTVGLVGLFMVSVLMLEPLAARGQVSTLKAANTVGALGAIPLVAAFVWLKGSVTGTTFLYFLCLTAPNLVLLVQLRGVVFRASAWKRLRWSSLSSTFKAGGWFYVTTLALIAKGHALTFIVSAISGPAMAGTFYVLLRITEIVGSLGATSSDTSLASLANEPSPQERGENFRHGYLYALIFSMHGTLALGFTIPLLLGFWLGPSSQITSAMSWAMAIYGLSAAYSKVAVNAAMGTGLVRQAALGNLAEAILVLVIGFIFQIYFQLTGLFMGASAAAVALFPVTRSLSQNFEETVSQTWFAPILSQKWSLLLSAVVLASAWWSGSLIVTLIALGVVGGNVLLSLKRLHG